jgi:hypothetical protein
MAGGGGWCSIEPVQATAGTQHFADVTLLPLFGCVLEVECEVPPAGLLLGGTRTFVEPDGIEGLTRVVHPSIECLLAGVLPPDWEERHHPVDSWRRTYLVYAARSHAPRIDGITVGFDVPGHRREAVAVSLQRLAGAWSMQVVRLARTAIGFGTLRVRWPPQMRDTEGGGYWDDSLKIVLRPKSEPEMAFELSVPQQGDSTVVGGMPLGVYDARLESRWGWSHPRGGWIEVEVDEDGGVIDVPVRGHGGIILEVSRFDSVQCHRSIAVLLKRPGARAPLRGQLSAPPYHLFGVPTGTQEVVVEVRENGVAVRKDCGTIDVEQGQWSRVEVAW